MTEDLPSTRSGADGRPKLAQVLKAGLLRPPRPPHAGESDPNEPFRHRLQAFQVDLLLADYQDFAVQPRFRSLVSFFFGSLYAPANFNLRNESFRSLHHWLTDLVGHDPVRVLGSAIELYELTESLDDDMVLALRASGAQTPDRQAWERAYRLVGRRLDRVRQVELLLENGRALEIACRVPFVHAQLRAVRAAAGLLGWGHVIDFLLEGQQAMVAARPIDPLLRAVEERETARICQLLDHLEPQ